MSEDRDILLGIDLCNDYIQVSCCDTEDLQVDSISVSQDKTKYRIPAVLCVRRETKEWLFGEAAVNCEKDENTVFISDILDMASGNAACMVFDREYSAGELYEKLFRRILSAIRQRLPGSIKVVVVTLKNRTRDVVDTIEETMGKLGIMKDRLHIITYLESFMYYAVCQNKDIWINDVGLFDFDADGMLYYRLSFGRKQEPVTIVAEKTDLSDTVSYEMTAARQTDQLAFTFGNVVAKLLHKQIISAVYVTGNGFEGSWSDRILKGMCVGRRVFKGQNLYVKGAGYAAGIFYNGKQQDYLLVGDDVLKSSIALKVYKNAGYHELALADIGESYYDAGGELEIILDDTNELDFIIRNVMKKDFICAIMTLDTLVARENKTVRLKVKLNFLDRNTAVITVRDIGFGDIYKTRHCIWEQILKI